MPSPIQEYLAELRRRLRGQPFLARRIEAEIADHLAEATAAARRAGASESAAEAEAVRRMGPVDQYVRRFPRALGPLRSLLWLGTTASSVAALWLVFVIAVVLPERDPGSRVLWTVTAAGLGLFCLLSVSWLRGGGRGRVLPTALLGCALAALTAGALGLGLELQVARRGGHFEGYLLLLGVLLIAHGGVAAAHTFLSLRVARRIALR